jgi:hypothetical protein
VSANRKAVFLNCLSWLNSDPASLGINHEQQHLFFTRLAKAWDSNQIETPLPIRLKLN